MMKIFEKRVRCVCLCVCVCLGPELVATCSGSATNRDGAAGIYICQTDMQHDFCIKHTRTF